MSKLIITAAITGAVHIPTMSDYLPVTPEQIIEDAVKAYEAGAAIAHIHVRDPQSGKPNRRPEHIPPGIERDQEVLQSHPAAHYRRRHQSDDSGEADTH
jgi:uncharacterized protein (DUF849 family)